MSKSATAILFDDEEGLVCMVCAEKAITEHGRMGKGIRPHEIRLVASDANCPSCGLKMGSTKSESAARRLTELFDRTSAVADTELGLIRWMMGLAMQHDVLVEAVGEFGALRASGKTVEEAVEGAVAEWELVDICGVGMCGDDMGADDLAFHGEN